jgi:hypothetical protein
LGAQCEKRIDYHWNDTTNRPIPYEHTSLKGVQLLLGASLKAGASASVAVHGLQNLGLDYSLYFNGTLGVGISVEQEISSDKRIEIANDSFLLYGFDKQIMGLTFTLALNARLDIALRRVAVRLPKPIEYYRTFLVVIRKHGSLATKEKQSGSPFEYDIETNRDSDFDPKELFDIIANIALQLFPELALDLRVTLAIASWNYFFVVGVMVSSTWTFGLNSDLCPCPYLYGRTVTNFTGYLRAPNFTVFRYTLLQELNKEFPLITNYPTPTQCIFSPQKAREGLASLRDDGSRQSFALTNFYFSKGPDSTASSFQPAIQLLDKSGRVLQDFQPDEINWKSPTATQTAHRGGCMVVLPPTNTILQWYASQTSSWSPNRVTAPVNLSFGRHSASLGSLANVTYDVAGDQNVEIFKESAGTGRAYVSFTPKVSRGSVLGAIVHSVAKEEPYEALVPAEVFDSFQPGNVTEFRAPDLVTVSVQSLSVTSQVATAQLTFRRNLTVLKVGFASNLRPNVDATSATFGIADVEFDRSDGAALYLDLSLGESKRTLSVPAATLSKDGAFTVQLAGIGAALTLSVAPALPTVVFEFSAPLSSNQRAIICRVGDATSGNATLPLEPGEAYGIFRFPLAKVPDSRYTAVILEMRDLVPLCDHRHLDEGMVVVPLVSGRTRFGNRVHIPFRRLIRGDERFTATARLVQVFATTVDGLCGPDTTLSTASGGAVGCLETVFDDVRVIEGWVAVQGGRDPYKASTIAGVRWRLHVFQVAAGEVSIYQSIFTIAEESPFFEFTASELRSFVPTRASIAVNCTRADWVQWWCGAPQTTGAAFRQAPYGFFMVQPCPSSGLIVAAVCNSHTEAFCQLETPAVSGVALVEYASDAGVHEAVSKDGVYLPGVSRQIVARRRSAFIYKTWRGAIKYMEVARPRSPTALVFNVSRSGGRVTIAALLGQVPIPLSAAKYYEDPLGFFDALAITIDDGPDASLVNFTGNAEVEVAADAFNESLLADPLDIFERVLDLPRDFLIPPPTPTPTSDSPKAAIVSRAIAAVVAFLAILMTF